MSTQAKQRTRDRAHSCIQVRRPSPNDCLGSVLHHPPKARPFEDVVHIPTQPRIIPRQVDRATLDPPQAHVHRAQLRRHRTIEEGESLSVPDEVRTRPAIRAEVILHRPQPPLQRLPHHFVLNVAIGPVLDVPGIERVRIIPWSMRSDDEGRRNGHLTCATVAEMGFRTTLPPSFFCAGTVVPQYQTSNKVRT